MPSVDRCEVCSVRLSAVKRKETRYCETLDSRPSLNKYYDWCNGRLSNSHAVETKAS